jgi:hypothetical protein
MSQRLVQVESLYFEWPVGSFRPKSFAITAERLSEYVASLGTARVANQAESQAALAANQAGLHGQALTEAELARVYRDNVSYERHFLASGLVPEARN